MHRQGLLLDLSEIARQGANILLAHGLEVKVDVCIEALTDQRNEDGHALVVRNGRKP